VGRVEGRRGEVEVAPGLEARTEERRSAACAVCGDGGRVLTAGLLVRLEAWLRPQAVDTPGTGLGPAAVETSTGRGVACGDAGGVLLEAGLVGQTVFGPGLDGVPCAAASMCCNTGHTSWTCEFDAAVHFTLTAAEVRTPSDGGAWRRASLSIMHHAS
jgi:hypothetical protein